MNSAFLTRLDALLVALPPDLRDRYGGDIAECKRRVVFARTHLLAIQGGCAARLMRVVVALRDRGEDFIDVYVLARDLIAHELRPSPDWRTLCAEAGLPESVFDIPGRGVRA